MRGIVQAVSVSPSHGFSKQPREGIRLLPGLGVEGDAHMGSLVQHVYLKKKDPARPNLTQVHLLHGELHDDLLPLGFALSAGQMGENVLTRGVDLLHLPVAARIHLGEQAVVEVTGLRHPCAQLNRFQPGLMKALLFKDEQGSVIRKAGIMAVVLAGGEVRPGDPIHVELPPEPWTAMGPV